MSLVRNEQAKLTATYLNGLAIAIGAVGGIAPWIGYVQGGNTSLPLVAGTTTVCTVLSLCLHLIARLILRGLKAPP